MLKTNIKIIQDGMARLSWPGWLVKNQYATPVNVS